MRVTEAQLARAKALHVDHMRTHGCGDDEIPSWDDISEQARGIYLRRARRRGES